MDNELSSDTTTLRTPANIAGVYMNEKIENIIPAQKVKIKRERKKNAFSSMSTSMLVSAAYDSQEKIAVLKFYEPKTQKIILWKDESDHWPYCYSKLNLEELDFLNERTDVIK